jgi:hypothetical protein
MTTSWFWSARRTGAVRLLSLLVVSGCGTEALISPPAEAPTFARGGGSGPTVKSADPDSGLRNTTIDVRVLGSGFDNGSKAVWALTGDTTFATTKIKTNSTRFVRSGELVANITIASDAPLASFDIQVLTAGGKKGIGIELFTVKETGQALYTLSFATDIQTGSVVFSGLAKRGDPFLGITGDNVYLTLPASTSGNTAVCNGDGSGLGATTNTWGGYVGEWKGTLSITKKRGLIYFSYTAAPADGSPGHLNLDAHAAFTETNSSGVITIAISSTRGMVGATSTPDGAGFDAVDRCLTFSVTATP